MTKIVSFGTSTGNKENPFKQFFEGFSKIDKFSKFFLITFSILILVVPIITTQYFDLRQQAMENQLGESLFFNKPAEDQIVVKFKPGISEDERKKTRTQNGLIFLEGIRQIGVELDQVEPAKRDPTVEVLKTDPRIEYSELNFYARAQSTKTSVNSSTGREQFDLGVENPILALIDSGVNGENSSKILKGYNFVNNNVDTLGEKAGNAVAQEILLKDPGVSVLPIKAIDDSGSISYWNGARAIIFAAENGSRIIIPNFAGKEKSNLLSDSINYAFSRNIVLIVPAGDNGTLGILYPASLNNVISVGSLDSNNQHSYFSGIGPELVLTANGTGIFGFSGTSLAVADVAAGAALILNANPKLNNSDVTNILTQSANHYSPDGWDEQYGFGKVNLNNAFEKAKSYKSIQDTEKPTISIVNVEDNALVSDFLTIKVNAQDNVLVNRVDFLIDGSAFASDSTSSYLAALDSKTIKNGKHTLTVEAFDPSGNKSSAEISIEVKN